MEEKEQIAVLGVVGYIAGSPGDIDRMSYKDVSYVVVRFIVKWNETSDVVIV